MSWLFSRALVEAFSEASSLDGEPSAPLSVMPTLHKFYRLDKMMEPSNLSRFGLTCAVLTEDRGEELLTSFLAVSLARTSAQPAEGMGSTGPSLDSGLNLHGSLARFDLDSSSWKTPQCSLIEGLDEFSETWPAWGSMRNGVSWGRTTPALPTSEKESGSWPTPRATQAMCYGKAGIPNSQCRLEDVVANFPTPMASDCEARGGHRGNLDTLTSFTKAFPTPCARDFRSPNLKPYSERGGGKKGEQLVNFIAHFPTPRAGSSNGGGTGLDGGSNARRALARDHGEVEAKALLGGQLNPPWVELLMGWPMDWTCIDPMSALQFRSWGDGFGTNPGRPEELPALWEATGTETIRGQVGRSDGLHQAEVLFAGLCQQPQASEALEHLSPEGQEIQEGCLRSLRLPEGASGPSCGPEPREQRPDQSPDTVQALPRLLAHYGPQAWQDGSWENAVPRVAQKVAHRVDRLKAIGNGQVPAVVQLAFQTLYRRLMGEPYE